MRLQLTYRLRLHADGKCNRKMRAIEHWVMSEMEREVIKLNAVRLALSIRMTDTVTMTDMHRHSRRSSKVNATSHVNSGISVYFELRLLSCVYARIQHDKYNINKYINQNPNICI